MFPDYCQYCAILLNVRFTCSTVLKTRNDLDLRVSLGPADLHVIFPHLESIGAYAYMNGNGVATGRHLQLQAMCLWERFCYTVVLLMIISTKHTQNDTSTSTVLLAACPVFDTYTVVVVIAARIRVGWQLVRRWSPAASSLLSRLPRGRCVTSSRSALSVTALTCCEFFSATETSGN